jgi:hypothetical protein
VLLNRKKPYEILKVTKIISATVQKHGHSHYDHIILVSKHLLMSGNVHVMTSLAMYNRYPQWKLLSPVFKTQILTNYNHLNLWTISTYGGARKIYPMLTGHVAVIFSYHIYISGSEKSWFTSPYCPD